METYPKRRKKFFLDFQNVCNKRLEERTSIGNLLNSIKTQINNMILIIEEGLKDVDKIDNQKVLELLHSEKEIFLVVAKAQLKELGFEVKSLEDVTDLEELNQVIFDKFVSRRFLDQVKKGRSVTKWNNRLRRIAVAYMAVFYIGFQIAFPAYLASVYTSPSYSTKNHYKEIYQKLQQDFETVIYTSSDGIQNTALLVKNKQHSETNKVVLFIHPRNYNATNNLNYIDQLRETTKDMDFFTPNLRNHGPDNPPGWLRSTTLGLKEAFDVIGAINYLAENGYTEIVVYGHSIGGAAVINALGKHQNLISNKIKVRGVIVDKTFTNSYDFMVRNHQIAAGNLGANLGAALTGQKEYPDIPVLSKILEPSGLQSAIAMKSAEKISGFKASENDPSEAIKLISVPIRVITAKGGDVFMTEEGARTLVKNAQHGKLILDYSNKSLIGRHEESSGNPDVVGKITVFIKKVMR